MTPLDIIATLLTINFVGYMILTDKKVGTAYSISDSWYSWKGIGESRMFIIFLTVIAVGLLLVTHFHKAKHETAFNLLLLGGGFTCYGIGIAANFKTGWRESMYHNIFSALTFGCVLLGFYIEGVQFPLYTFALLSAVFLFIDIPKRTTIIESVGIGVSIISIYYLR